MHCTLPSSLQLRTDTPYYLHGYLEKEVGRYFLLRNSICIEIHQLREKASASYCMSDILLVYLKYRMQRSKWYRSKLSRWSLAIMRNHCMKFLVTYFLEYYIRTSILYREMNNFVDPVQRTFQTFSTTLHVGLTICRPWNSSSDSVYKTLSTCGRRERIFSVKEIERSCSREKKKKHAGKTLARSNNWTFDTLLGSYG